MWRRKRKRQIVSACSNPVDNARSRAAAPVSSRPPSLFMAVPWAGRPETIAATKVHVEMKAKTPRGVLGIGAPGSPQERVLVVYPVSEELLIFAVLLLL